MEKNLFYKTGVDISSVKSMFNFINNHFTYNTMNSWNKLESIANNVKLYNLGLDCDWGDAMDAIFEDGSELCYLINDLINDWEKSNPRYSLGFNGRSGGYLVMYNRERDGRVNMRHILPEYYRGCDTYDEWKSYVKECYGSCVKDFKCELREYTRDIQSFDKLCDELRTLVNDYLA